MADDEYPRFRPVEAGPPRVPCAHCGRLIVGASTRCEYCGIHFFEGTATDYAMRPSERQARGAREPDGPVDWSQLKRAMACKRARRTIPWPVFRCVSCVILIVLAAMFVVLFLAGVWLASI